MAAKEMEQFKTIHKELLSRHFLQINFKLQKYAGGPGEWEWFMETGKSTTA